MMSTAGELIPKNLRIPPIKPLELRLFRAIFPALLGFHPRPITRPARNVNVEAGRSPSPIRDGELPPPPAAAASPSTERQGWARGRADGRRGRDLAGLHLHWPCRRRLRE